MNILRIFHFYRIFLKRNTRLLITFSFLLSFYFSFGQIKSDDSNLKTIAVDFECKIYPNPSTDYIFFKTSQNYDGLNICIINAKGQTVKTINPKDKNLVRISLSELQSGMYFMTIKSRKEILGIKQFLITR